MVGRASTAFLSASAARQKKSANCKLLCRKRLRRFRAQSLRRLSKQRLSIRSRSVICVARCGTEWGAAVISGIRKQEANEPRLTSDWQRNGSDGDVATFTRRKGAACCPETRSGRAWRRRPCGTLHRSMDGQIAGSLHHIGIRVTGQGFSQIDGCQIVFLGSSQITRGLHQKGELAVAGT